MTACQNNKVVANDGILNKYNFYYKTRVYVYPNIRQCALYCVVNSGVPSPASRPLNLLLLKTQLQYYTWVSNSIILHIIIYYIYIYIYSTRQNLRRGPFSLHLLSVSSCILIIIRSYNILVEYICCYQHAR